jgi:DNA repair protein RecO (recombination protein O)
MSLERATGIVLRTRPLTDTGLIVHWLTADLGRLATVAKGARRPKSPFRGQIDLFYLAELSFHRSRRSELHTLREVKLTDSHPALRQDLSSLRQAAYCASLIEQNTESEAPMPVVFDQFAKLVRALPGHSGGPEPVFAFEMKMLAELGLTPNLAETQISPDARQILAQFVQMEWPAILRLRLSGEQVGEVGQFLQGFLAYHLGRVPRGRARAVAPGDASAPQPG